MDDVHRDPVPGAKPDPHAQWDEAAGRWEVWSDDAGGWVSLDDGSVQSPATPSVDIDGEAERPVEDRPEHPVGDRPADADADTD
jgi:hypothetical protein